MITLLAHQGPAFKEEAGALVRKYAANCIPDIKLADAVRANLTADERRFSEELKSKLPGNLCSR